MLYLDGLPRLTSSTMTTDYASQLHKTMKLLRTLSFLCVAFSVASISAHAATWPKLNATAPAQCTEALQIAKVAFDSNTFYLFAPPVIPENLQSNLALKPQALDISGGDALEADEAIFEKLPIGGEGAPRSIYWQRAATYRHRLVVLETPFGWRGDMYSLFAVGDEVQPDNFLADIRGNSTTQNFASIISDRWRPPLIFRERRSDGIWFIDVGQPYQFLADWQVYVVGPSGIKLRCAVQFRPNVKRAITLLPKPVRELARLLDQTMGRGENEGTLQPTSRLRLGVEHTWANAALRPWVSGAPYNNREEVHAGLKSWSQTGATYRMVYQAIQRQYPVAERSLADYYQRHFGLSASEAKELSAYILDIAFRSHYAFHSEDRNSYFRDHNSPKSPWWNR